MSDIEKQIQQILKEIKEIKANQKESNKKLSYMEEAIDNIKNDFYVEDDNFEFEIVCPYCDNEFIIDDPDKTEVQCPECNNTIELDWSGNLDDEDSCSGSCHGCSGCGTKDEDNDM